MSQISLGSRLDNSSRVLKVITGVSPGEELHQDGLQQPQDFQILYQDEHLIAIDKPSGFHVHAPEDGWKIPREGITMELVRCQKVLLEYKASFPR